MFVMIETFLRRYTHILLSNSYFYAPIFSFYFCPEGPYERLQLLGKRHNFASLFCVALILHIRSLFLFRFVW